MERIISTGENPDVNELAAAGNNGAQPTDPQVLGAVTGNDTAGVISITTGVNATEGDLIEIVFDKVYDRPPVVTLTPLGQDAASLRYYVKEVTTTKFIISTLDSAADDTTYEFQYHVIQ